jgi:RNA polymerase sigma-70 factor, Bacteroides expansion family 1
LPESITHRDRSLLMEIAAGNENAFNELFEMHRAKLFNYLFDIVKIREVAEELVTDVFLKLWFGRELATEIQQVDAFLFKIAYHKALNFLRLTSRRRDLQKLVAYGIEKAAFNEAEEKLTREEYRRLLNTAIAQLTPQRQHVYRLSREQGMTHEQIAAALDLSPNTVKNHITESTKIIREFLQSRPGGALMVLVLLLTGE